MSIKKKKEQVIPVDENGNPIEVKEEEKKVDGKTILKNVLGFIGSAAIGIAIFLAVGAAMVDPKEGESGDGSSDSGSSSGTGSEAGSASES